MSDQTDDGVLQPLERALHELDARLRVVERLHAQDQRSRATVGRLVDLVFDLVEHDGLNRQHTNAPILAAAEMAMEETRHHELALIDWAVFADRVRILSAGEYLAVSHMSVAICAAGPDCPRAIMVRYLEHAVVAALIESCW